jgi:HK97 family phage major capsid protein
MVQTLLKPRIEIRSYPSILEEKNNLIEQMDSLVNKAKTEKRNLTSSENQQFENMKNRVEDINKKIENEPKIEKRVVGKASNAPMNYEARGYKKEERIGTGMSNVSVGDLIYSHVTGRYKSQEVRDLLTSTPAGIALPSSVYGDFIDLLRNQSILGECTVYPMDTQTLVIPRVTADIQPHFKLEGDPVNLSQPAFTGITLRARPLYAMTSISLELIESSNLDVGQVITQVMANSMRAAMQTFMLTGAVNGYTGILNDTGLNTVTAAAIDYAAIGSAVQAVRAANGEPNGLVISADNLMGLELSRDTTNQFIQPPSFYQDLNKFSVGTDIGNDRVLLGDLSTIAFGVLSENGLQIEVSRDGGDSFERGMVLVRARINGDFALTNPKLMSLVTVGTV